MRIIFQFNYYHSFFLAIIKILLYLSEFYKEMYTGLLQHHHSHTCPQARC